MLTILLPTYNRAHVIGSCIKSIVAQTSRQWKLHIIDNSSTDNTEEVCRSFAANDTNIVYHRFNNNVPVFANWERTLQFVDTDYYIVFSDDDHMCSRYIEIVIQQLNSLSPDLLITNRATYAPLEHKSIVPNKLALTQVDHFSFIPQRIPSSSIYVPYITCEILKEIDYLALHPSMFIYSSTLMRRLRSLYGGIYLPSAHDYFANVLFALYSKNVHFLNLPLVSIGGLVKAPYCFCSNKFDYFGMKFDFFSTLSSLPSFRYLTPVLQAFRGYPYFRVNILKQTLITIANICDVDPKAAEPLIEYIHHHELGLVDGLIGSCIAEHDNCLKIGDSADRWISFLKKKSIYSSSTQGLSSRVFDMLRACLKMFVPPSVMCKLYSSVSKSAWVPLTSKSLDAIPVALDDYLNHIKK